MQSQNQLSLVQWAKEQARLISHQNQRLTSFLQGNLEFGACQEDDSVFNRPLIKQESNHPEPAKSKVHKRVPAKHFICGFRNLANFQTCKKKFTSESELTAHKATHEQAAMALTCQVCSTQCRSAAALAKHKKTHEKREPVHCYLQRYFFGATISGSLTVSADQVKIKQQHFLQQSNAQATGQQATCKFCFYSQIDIVAHVCSSHLNEYKFQLLPESFCKICKTPNNDFAALKQHYRQHHKVADLLDNGIEAWLIFETDQDQVISWFQTRIPMLDLNEPSPDQLVVTLGDRLGNEQFFDNPFVTVDLAECTIMKSSHCDQVASQVASIDCEVVVPTQQSRRESQQVEPTGEVHKVEGGMDTDSSQHKPEAPDQVIFGLPQEPILKEDGPAKSQPTDIGGLTCITCQQGLGKTNSFFQGQCKKCYTEDLIEKMTSAKNQNQQEAGIVKKTPVFSIARQIPTRHAWDRQDTPSMCFVRPLPMPKAPLVIDWALDCPECEPLMPKPQSYFKMVPSTRKVIKRAKRLFSTKPSPEQLRWLATLRSCHYHNKQKVSSAGWLPDKFIQPQEPHFEGIELVEMSDEAQPEQPSSGWEHLLKQETALQTQLLDKIERAESSIRQLSCLIMEIPLSEHLDEDDTPELYIEQVRKEFQECGDTRDAVARHTFFNERGSLPNVTFEDYFKVKKLIVPQSSVSFQYQNGSFSEYTSMNPEWLKLKTKFPGRFMQCYSTQQVCVIDLGFKRALTRNQMSAVIKQVLVYVNSVFSRFVDFKNPEHNVDMKIPDPEEMQLVCMLYNTLVFAIDTHVAPQKITTDFAALIQTPIARTFFVCTCGRKFYNLNKTLHHRRTGYHESESDIFENIYCENVKRFGPAPQEHTISSKQQMALKTKYLNIVTTDFFISDVRIFESFPVRHRMLEIQILQVAKLLGLRNRYETMHSEPSEVIKSGQYTVQMGHLKGQCVGKGKLFLGRKGIQ